MRCQNTLADTHHAYFNEPLKRKTQIYSKRSKLNSMKGTLMEYNQLTLNIQGIQSVLLDDQKEAERAEQRDASLSDKIEFAKKAILLASDMSKTYYQQPLIITYSGGKDSDVLLHIAENCLKSDEFEVLNSHTSVDAPETVYHIRNVFKRLSDKGIKATIYQPKDKDGNPITMWNLIPKMQIPPTRLQRYCCKVLKETSTPNRICLTGVREAESSKRKGRDIFNTRGATYKDALFFSLDHALEVHQESQAIQDDNWDCTLIKQMKDHNDVVVTPIYYWSDDDIWNYIKANDMEVNPLYSRGYARVGCIGCPMANLKQVTKQFNDYPTYKKAYISAFDRMLAVRKSKGKDDITGKEGYHLWDSGQTVYEWWIETYKRQIKGQMNLEDML